MSMADSARHVVCQPGHIISTSRRWAVYAETDMTRPMLEAYAVRSLSSAYVKHLSSSIAMLDVLPVRDVKRVCQKQMPADLPRTRSSSLHMSFSQPKYHPDVCCSQPRASPMSSSTTLHPTFQTLCPVFTAIVHPPSSRSCHVEKFAVGKSKFRVIRDC